MANRVLQRAFRGLDAEVERELPKFRPAAGAAVRQLAPKGAAEAAGASELEFPDPGATKKRAALLYKSGWNDTKGKQFFQSLQSP